MNSKLHKLFRFFFIFPPRPGQNPLYEKITLFAIYGLIAVTLCALLIIHLIIGIRPDFGTILVCSMSAGALAALWAFRSPRAAGIIVSGSIIVLMGYSLLSGGGESGFRVLYVLTLPLFLYFLTGYKPALGILTVYSTAFVLMIHRYPFSPGSIFAQAEYQDRLGLAIIISSISEGIFMSAFELMIRHLGNLAFVDLGTGLPNHRSLQDFVEDQIEAAQSNGTEVSLTAFRVLDISRLESIYGTGAVEAMIGRIGQRLSAASGKASMVGRWKPAMFMAVYPTYEEGTAEALLEALRVTQNGDFPAIAPAVAAARCTYPTDAINAAALLSGTAAMLEIPTVSDGDILLPDRAWTEREAIKHALIRVIENGAMDGEFKVRYQPKIRLSDRTSAGAEALLRWIPPQGKPIPPDTFIPLAEEAGLITHLTRWVIGRVFADHAQNAELFGSGGVPPCSVNLSLHDLRDKTLMHTIENAIAETGCKPEWIEFEITERLMVDDDSRVKASLDDLYAAGFHIFIDDFGTGYSSLSYLHKLKTHGLKLDRSFLLAPEHGAAVDYPVVNAILSMSAALDLAVTAEGVETEEQAEYLSRRGCDLAQGWLFSRDLEFSDYVKFHRHWTASGIVDITHEPA